MAFPQSALDSVVELYLGSWVNVTATGDVLQDEGITIVRGTGPQSGQTITPASCTFHLRNTVANNRAYDPRWPASPYYGVIGRGTPVRVARGMVTDSMAGRTVSNGWGTTSDSGYAWANAWNTGANSDFAVSGGTATHSVSAANQWRASTLTGFSLANIDMYITASLSFTDVTGAQIEPANLIWRWQDSSNYYLVRVAVATDETVSIDFRKVIAGVESALTYSSGPVTVSGLTHSSSHGLTVRVACEGHVCSAKVWNSSSSEPYAWQVVGRDISLPTGGSVGVRSGVASGNTNTKPIVFSYSGFRVLSPRFFGEIGTLAQKQDQSGNRRWAEVEANDIFRRLQSSGQAPLHSTLWRGYTSDTTNTPVAYWPCEDGSDSTQAAAYTSGVFPIEVTQGNVDFGAYSGFDCSDAIPQTRNGTAHAIVPDHTVGYEQVRFLAHLPTTLTDGQAICTIHTKGTIARWRLTWHTGGGLKLTWFDTNVSYVGDSGVWAFGWNDDSDRHLSIELRQNGANIDTSFVTITPGASSGPAGGGTATTQTMGSVTDVYICPDMDITGMAFGHVTVQNAFSSLFSLGSQLNAWRGEYAANRVDRLANENGFDSLTWRSLQDPEPWTKVGPQQIKTLVDLLGECAVADMGIIIGRRISTDITYRTYPSLTAQAVSLALDKSAGQLDQIPNPTDDDSQLVNDFTAKRLNGSSYRATVTTGRLGTATPANGGAGTYPGSATYNVYNDGYLPDLAGWKVNTGTYDGARYPTIAVALHNPRIAANSTLVRQTLDTDLGDLITVSGLTPFTERMIVLGYTERMSSREHGVVYNCAPGAIYNVGVADDAGSRADATNSTLSQAITSTATSFFVTTAATSKPWIDSATYASEFPLDIAIAGERITVTAITNNLLTNTTFETGVSSWTGVGGTLTQSSTQAHSGTFSARMVPDGTSGQDYMESEQIPAVAGQSVTISCWVRFTNSVTGTFSASVNAYDSGGGYLTTLFSLGSVSAATWTQITNTYTLPANTAHCSAVLQLTGTPSAGQVWYADDVSLSAQWVQKFTATRSVNSVVKAQSAGAAVQLADPVYAAAGIQT
jgi:Carbohydrate binding domain